MLSKEELKKIVDALPLRGYKLIADRLGISKATVQKVFDEPKRYRQDVIDTAFILIRDHNAKIEEQRKQIKKLTTAL